MKPWHIFWGGLLAVGLVAETIALVNKESDDTLSDTVWDNPHPMIPLAIGVVIGHWFWSRPVTTQTIAQTIAEKD